MIPMHEAQKRLLHAGYVCDLQSPYREVTIINAKIKDVKKFMEDIDYEGKYVCIGEKKEQKTKAEVPEEYEQMSLFGKE